MDREIQVSVYCLAYNHAKYIRKTLDGFVNQKTSFRFKVYIHDDASTDETADIIREYEARYPDIIDAVYQRENQYSKKVSIVKTYLLPKFQGKYLAVCEGDDYWCDENKLQKQFDLMEQNPDLVFCMHRVGIISEAGDDLQRTFPAMKMESGFLTSKQFVAGVCSDFFQISSLFCRLDVFKEYKNNPREFAIKADVGDIPLFLHLGSMSEKMYFFNEIMSCYRMNSMSSVTRMISQNKEKLRQHLGCMMAMIDSFDHYTFGRYHEECDRYRERESFETYLKMKDIKTIAKNKAYRRRFIALPIRWQASVIIKGALYPYVRRKLKLR